MNKLLNEIKTILIVSLIYSIPTLIVFYILKTTGLYNGKALDFLLKSLLGLAIIIAINIPSTINEMRREKEAKDTELKIKAIPKTSKCCKNCKFSTHSHENKYKCAEGTFKELVDGDYCCVFWEPSPIVWENLLNLRLK